jgi:hypothetical protein
MIMIWLTLAAAVLVGLVWAVAAVMWWVVVPAPVSLAGCGAGRATPVDEITKAARWHLPGIALTPKLGTAPDQIVFRV